MILHVNSEYTNNVLYKSLIESISIIGDNQHIIYAPIKRDNEFGINSIAIKNVENIYSQKLKLYHKIHYFNKMNYLANDLINKIDIFNIKLSHAYKLFSDGGIAYILHKKYAIPYLVTIRNSDINIFLKYMIHLKPFVKKILLNAKGIVFISPPYIDEIRRKFPDIFSKIQNKIIVVPNGIDNFWHENTSRQIKKLSYPIRILYAGRFDKNKNIENLIKTAQALGENYILRIVGGGGDNEQKIKKIASNNPNSIELYPKVNKEELLKHYRESHIFVMPSFFETFGLVYIEAMTQGLPVVYSKGQGIDGYFEEGYVGYSVNPKRHETILQATRKITDRYNEISNNCIKSSSDFKWTKIALTYLSMYENIIQRN